MYASYTGSESSEEREIIKNVLNSNWKLVPGSIVKQLEEIHKSFKRNSEPPLCEKCGGYIKTATISFGQPMPLIEMQRAQEEAFKADLFVVVGSSLVVYPAASLPLIAK